MCVHRARWNAAGTEATLWNRTSTTRDATLAGALMQLAAWLCFTRVVVVLDTDEGEATTTTTTTRSSSARWIRTDGWVLPLLRLVTHSYWLCRVDEDEMLRLVYDATGRVVWQYRMKRVARADGTRTRFHADFLHARAGAPYLLAL